MLRQSANSGGTWKAVKNLGSGFPGDILASGTNVYTFWSDGDIRFRRSTDYGATWNAIVNLSNNAGHSMFRDAAVLGGNLYVVWYQANVANTLQDISFRRSTDSGASWGSNVNISQSNAGVSDYSQVAVTSSGIYVVWQDDTPGNYDILLRRSTDGGATWKPVKNLSNNQGSSDAPQIGT